MIKPLVRMLRLNGLQYNPNRDQQVYRRPAGEAFVLQAFLDGSGAAECRVNDAAGKLLASGTVARPGLFKAELKFDSPGSRVVALSIVSGAERFEQLLRLDALAPEHAH